MEDLSGKQLGQYQIISPLGEGGMAVVYKAYQPSMERFVALKILPHQYAMDPDFIRRFKIEAKTIASLEHPNILTVHDFGEADGYTFLVMRFVEGQSLTKILQNKPLPLPQIFKLISQIAEALDYAHSRGVVHRDVKPGNVLIDEHGNCLLSDFGLAKVLIGSSQFTSSGAFLGTPTYASPEQCLGRSNIDQRSDIYSLGVMLYEMVTGRPPFNADTPMGVVIKHIQDPLPMPRKLNPSLPESVELVILKALAKKPEDRFSSASDLAKALSIALKQLSVGGKSTTKIPGLEKKVSDSARTDSSRKAKRKISAWIYILGCLVFLSVVTIIITGTWLINNIKSTVIADQNKSFPVLTETISKPTGTRVPPLATSTAPLLLKTTTIIEEQIIPTTSIPLATPTIPPAGGAPLSQTELFLPISEPRDLVYTDRGLWVLTDKKLTRLEILEAEGRFRNAEQMVFIGANSLAWDKDADKFWAIPGSLYFVDKVIDFVNYDGTLIQSYNVPETFDGSPSYITWDGEFLWIGSDSGVIYKLNSPLENNNLEILDAFAPVPGEFDNRPAMGLAWDGNNLWILVDYFISKLSSTVRPVCRIELTGGEWYGWRGLTWDGQFLWVGHQYTNAAYRIDPASCK